VDTASPTNLALCTEDKIHKQQETDGKRGGNSGDETKPESKEDGNAQQDQSTGADQNGEVDAEKGASAEVKSEVEDEWGEDGDTNEKGATIERDESFDIYGDLEKDDDADNPDGFLPDDTGFSPSGTPRSGPSGTPRNCPKDGSDNKPGPMATRDSAGKVETKLVRSVTVRGMQWWTSDADLEKFFSECGPVNKIVFQAEVATGKSLGIACVEFVDSESVDVCVCARFWWLSLHLV
jgi:hypothetical protein